MVRSQSVYRQTHATRLILMRTGATVSIELQHGEAHVLPMYKESTQKNHWHIVKKHLLPQFGHKAVAEVTRQEVQAYVAYLARAGYAPKTTITSTTS